MRIEVKPASTQATFKLIERDEVEAAHPRERGVTAFVSYFASEKRFSVKSRVYMHFPKVKRANRTPEMDEARHNFNEGYGFNGEIIRVYDPDDHRLCLLPWKTMLSVRYIVKTNRFDALWCNQGMCRTTSIREVMWWLQHTLKKAEDRQQIANAMWAWMLTVSNGRFNPASFDMGLDEQLDWDGNPYPQGNRSIETMSQLAQYPLIREWILTHPNQAERLDHHQPNARILKQQTMIQALNVMSGRRRKKYRKDFVRMAALVIQDNPSVMPTAVQSIMKSSAEGHWLPLLTAARQSRSLDAIASMRELDYKAFKKLSYHRYLRIINEHNGVRYYCDALTTQLMLEATHGVVISITECRTGKEAHDRVEHVMGRFRALPQADYWQTRVDNQKELEIPQEPYEKLLAAKLPTGIELITPKVGYDVVLWGNEMDFCIGSYVAEAARGDILLFGINQNSKLLGCGMINIREGRLVQMLAYRNYALPDDVKWSIFNALLETKVIKDIRDGWGMEHEVPNDPNYHGGWA